jgi:hypothetical protein
VSGLRSPLFFLILAVYLLAGTLFATLTPNWQAPDEPAHYNYVRYLANQAGFPELVSGCYNQAYLQQLTSRRFPPELAVKDICYEFHQPPLYYLVATPLFILTGGSLTLLRLFSAGLGAGVVTLAFLIGRAVFPGQDSVAYGSMALVAFVPMHLVMLAAVNNDALAELILAALMLLLTRRIRSNREPTRRDNVGLGLILGLGLITKTTVYIAVPLILVALWLEAARTEGNAIPGATQVPLSLRPILRPAARAQWVKPALIIYGLAFGLALPWYIRNASLYGNFDLLGLGRHNQVVVGQLRTADFLAQVGWQSYIREFITTTFQSFWGQFGWMAVPMSNRVYLALTLLSLTAVGGLVELVKSGGKRQGLRANPLSAHYAAYTRRYQALILLALTIGLMLLGYGWYNLEFKQFQGRYLFPALIPIGLFFTLGLRTALSWSGRWWLVVGLALALAGITLLGVWSGDVDKWSVLMTGLGLGLAAGRIWLARYWFIPTSWLITAIYAGLALLALLSPFWYVIPYLSP